MSDADPMDVLRLPIVAVTPRPAFAAELRGRVAALLGGDDDPAAAPAPARPSVVPYLSVRRGAAAIRWYVEVLGAEPIGDPIVEESGRVGHMELRLGDARFALADEYPELDIVGPESRGGTSVRLQLAVDDCDAVYVRALAAGAVGLRPPADQFYGARAAHVRDPFGHEWALQQFLEDVPAEVMRERLAGTEFAVVDLGDRPEVTPEQAGTSEPPVTSESPVTHEQRAPDRAGDLGYFTIDTPDAQATEDFFGQLLGWVIRPANGDPGSRHIESIAPPAGIHGGADVGYTMYFRVEDLAAMAERVRALGGTVVSMDQHPSGGDAECIDPQGLRFHLWKAAPGY